ncbi:MAG: hypothetical protein ABI354_02900 [Candidatus Saccharimonadales bacterium]
METPKVGVPAHEQAPDLTEDQLFVLSRLSEEDLTAEKPNLRTRSLLDVAHDPAAAHEFRAAYDSYVKLAAREFRTSYKRYTDLANGDSEF